MAIAVYPGSFDPFTFGHLDIATRAAKIFATVNIVVVHNPAKSSRFTSAERVEMIQAALKDVPGNFKVSTLDNGLLVDYCRQAGASVLVKGIRSSNDVEYELAMAKVNRDLTGIETIFLPGEPANSLISSTLVKQVADLGGDISKYVPDEVAKRLRS